MGAIVDETERITSDDPVSIRVRVQISAARDALAAPVPRIESYVPGKSM
jgi:hypothetical protein